MRRREILASASTLLASGLAGCLGATAEGSRQSTATRTTSASGPAPELTVDVERLQPAVLVATDDSVAVRGTGNQHVFVHVDVTAGEPPERLEFGFRLGGRTYGPGVTVGEELWRERAAGGRYDGESGSGWLVFEVPANWGAKHAVVSLGSREWPVGGALRERLSNPAPDLSLAWDVPETVRPGETPMDFSVRNDGERDARFVGAVTATGSLDAEHPIAVFNRRIPAGETVSWTTTHENGFSAGDEAVGDGQTDGSHVLSWTDGRRKQAARVVSR